MFADAYRGRRVWVTGHNGFKGTWLCEWLVQLGASVSGFSLPPDPASMFARCGTGDAVASTEGDVREPKAVAAALSVARPDMIFHLAAQSLVRPSYQDPALTFDTNVMGTVRVLDALRRLGARIPVIVATSDKCYLNREWEHGYREDDPLGGRDPYSASKSAAEMVVRAFRESFPDTVGTALATVRAGNVIGGGDFAVDRIVPDCARASLACRPISVRNPGSVRPWQHVLEPLAGYLWLGAVLLDPTVRPQAHGHCATAFNFGPDSEAHRTVGELVDEWTKAWPGSSWRDESQADAPHEARLLHLAIDRARAILGWTPVWSFATAVRAAVEWYSGMEQSNPAGLRRLTHDQIAHYATSAAERNVVWVRHRN